MDEALKVAMDRILALAGLVVLSPVLLLLALIVKLDSPGPVLHRRVVMARGGGRFEAFKLRTMFVNGDDILARHPRLKAKLAHEGKLKEDPRVTRTGRWLRKMSLDELPQLLNVLRGQMSLVGPRMISPAELERYGEHAHELMRARPGITGLWQVSGRTDLMYDERVRLTMEYLHNRSILLDIQLLIMTIPAVIKGRGAY